MSTHVSKEPGRGTQAGALAAPDFRGGARRPNWSRALFVRCRPSLVPQGTFPDGVRLLLRIALLALLAGVLLHIAYAGFGLGRGSLDSLFSDWLYNAILLGSAGVCAAAAIRRRSGRTPWLVLAVGMFAWSLGDVYWTFFLSDLESAPFPSLADALWLLYYPPAYVALVLLVRDSVRRFHGSVWLDGLIGAFTVAGIATAFVIAPILSDVGGSFAAVATTVAYPLADLLLLLFVVGIFALNGWKPGRGWMLIGGAFATTAAADTIYLYRVANGTYVSGTILDSLWLVGIAALAYAACQPPLQPGEIRLEGWRVLLAPFLFTLASIGLLIAGNFHHVNVVALCLAVAALVASILRTAMTFREVRTLAETRRQALTDDLTGLGNRRLFYRQLKKALADADRHGQPLALLMIDLDRFKELNDTLGHYAGDLLLQQIGPRLRGVLRSGETLARLGGDEFGVLTDAPAAAAVAQRIVDALQEPYSVAGVTVHIDASIGIALYPEDAVDADSLLQHADVAMYQAKGAHTAWEFYAPERDHHSRERLALLGELRRAIETGQLVLHYQPKSDIRTGEVTGMEALVRWLHPARGLLPPVEFVPIAEQTGVMRLLTLDVLNSALRRCSEWLAAGHGMSVAVNVSATSLLDLEFANELERLLKRWNVPPQWLQLEITENAIMADPIRTVKVLDDVRGLGVEVSLDDFGTGYSSLSFLKQLHVDEIKIDKSFVMNMENDPSDAAIVRSTLELARSLNIRSVAEGVENAEVLERLSSFGCDLAQGYHISRPLPPDELERWLGPRKLDRRQPLAPAILRPAIGLP